MNKKKKIVCVIPARLDSSRFPRKILSILAGKPLLQWAWDAANQTQIFDQVVIALDDLETANVVEDFHGQWVMTDKSCLSGTERLLELQRKKLVEGDIWVNWQADEPFLCKEMIENLLQSVDDPFADVWTLKEKIYTEDQIIDPNICKVVCDQNGYALYFSRSPIPYRRDKKDILIFRHVGLYAYTQSALQRMQSMKPCPIEEAESLEQLRFLFGGLKIQVHETEYSSLGIDLPGHLILAEEYIKKMSPLGF